jgi:hypothetical protein
MNGKSAAFTFPMLQTGTEPLDRFVRSDRQTVAMPTNAVRFSGRYTPKEDEMAWIKQGLMGYPAWSSGIMGPNYFPEKKTENALLVLMTDDKPISPEVVENIARSKTRVMNTFALYNNKPIRPVSDYLAEAGNFAQQIKEEANDIKGVFKSQLRFDDAGIAVLHAFMAKTAPILFNMDFPDAMRHASQVTKLAAFKAAAMGAGRSELLQAAMVGWLHDPKFRGDLSRDNLATHPVVASAIADAIFADATFKKRLSTYLKSQQPAKTFKPFATGVVEALSINNDSRFVNQNVIIKRLISTFEDTYGPEIARRLEELATERLDSPSRGETPQPLPQDIIGALRNIRLETGIIGVRKQALVSPEMRFNSDLVAAVIDGKITDPQLVTDLHRKLKDNNGFIQCNVDALTMFSHHSEVAPAGRIAALALVNADPLLLSPHKVVAATPRTVPWVNILTSFGNSFMDNINDLPMQNQIAARPWQRAVLVSVLNTADLLAGRERGILARQAADRDILSEIKNMKQLISDPATWGETAQLKEGDTDFATRYTQAFEALEGEYQRMVKQFRQAAFKNDSSDHAVI